MEPLFKGILLLAMLATLVVLIMGILELVKKDRKDPERSNKLMRLRVFFQAIALGVLALLFFLRK